ncbi:MAG: sigma-70 family RNA polymerase sigma factor, partial [Candidatus Binatia bacterium]
EFIRVIDQGWQYLLSRHDVDPSRVAVGGYCMGGRIGIHFAAATPTVRAFVGYSPTVRDETITPVRPLPPWEAARMIQCPSIVLYGAHDRVTTLSLQTRLWEAFLANGQTLEWHFLPFGGHGFVDPETFGYQPQAAELAWPLVVGFLERELIAKAVPDKQALYAEIYKSHYARVVRLSRLLLSDPDEAEEVGQDVFFKLFKEYQSRNSTMAWGPWLMRVTINACRDRQRSAWWKWLRAPMKEFQEADHACHGQTPEEAMVWREERGRIWGSLQELSSRQREVFVLRHVQGWSTQEVAETLQLSPGSVKRHLFRAVCHLRKALGNGL